ncbi:IclR family transcriptional regulator [Klebsiella pneumoniae subsp. pneumoniae]|uniref:IclR family transcriptional regulator n=1 Tax=Klebsiella pneumoniae subsp. pneumoniae TaxID=72407 RepID=A0A377YY04_KLEPN|nr:IclR family transcriptional regulator [Klebsiella pneumoniae subsp. pneumoniae]
MVMKESETGQDKERPAGSQSLFRGLMLIEILSNYPNGCPLAHLSELAGLNKSTVHRLLQGLQSCGYVTPARRRVAIGSPPSSSPLARKRSPR